MDNYERSERIAIRMDSHMTESEAVRQTDAELKAKQPIESIQRIENLKERKKLDDVAKRHKHSPRNYE